MGIKWGVYLEPYVKACRRVQALAAAFQADLLLVCPAKDLLTTEDGTTPDLDLQSVLDGPTLTVTCRAAFGLGARPFCGNGSANNSRGCSSCQLTMAAGKGD
jgi:hypothetical protein